VGVETKICGLTRPEDAALAVQLGAWRLGVVFAGGPRRVTPGQAAAIVLSAGKVPVIGVYQDQDVETILDTSRIAGLSGAQLHGEYTDADAEALRLAGLEVWRVRLLAPDAEGDGVAARLARHADVVLVEPRHPDRSRDRRLALDLERARAVRATIRGPRVALAGGLTPESVGAAIRVVGPDAVDVSSGVERAPGIKDPARMARFLEQVRDAHAAT
jgi:phosphoribosylanthranilate isomerase